MFTAYVNAAKRTQSSLFLKAIGSSFTDLDRVFFPPFKTQILALLATVFKKLMFTLITLVIRRTGF